MSGAEGDFRQGLKPLLDALDHLGAEWFVGGSVASSTLSVARATQDVDLVAALDPRDVPALVSLLGTDYFADEPSMTAAIARGGPFNVLHLPTMLKIDVFPGSRTAFAREEMSRRRRLGVPGLDEPIFVATAEDMVLRKLAWYRDGGSVSERQWLDVQALLRFNGDVIDLAYMRRWAPALDVVELLERALGEAGLSATGAS